MDKLLSKLFPKQSRSFPGQRWAKIALRTIHLLGIAGIGGGLIYPSPEPFWKPFMVVIILSGIAFVSLEIWSNGVWIIQVRGMAVFTKLIILFFLFTSMGSEMLLTFAIIIISGIISHAPGDFRYFSVFHSKRMDTF